jgi:hypothetical protein
MPRYYFHVRKGGDLDPDETGVEFPTDLEALTEAKRAVADMVRDGSADF